MAFDDIIGASAGVLGATNKAQAAVNAARARSGFPAANAVAIHNAQVAAASAASQVSQIPRGQFANPANHANQGNPSRRPFPSFPGGGFPGHRFMQPLQRRAVVVAPYTAFVGYPGYASLPCRAAYDAWVLAIMSGDPAKVQAARQAFDACLYG